MNHMMAMHSVKRSKQQGASMLFIGFILVILALIGKFAFSVVPFYEEYAAISRSVNQLSDKPNARTMTGTNLKSSLLNILYINSVRTVKDANFKEHFYLKKTGSGRDVIIKYQREALFFKNIYLTVKFEETVTL